MGNVADLDPMDGNGSAENQGLLIGTYFNGSDHAADHIVDIVAQDANPMVSSIQTIPQRRTQSLMI